MTGFDNIPLSADQAEKIRKHLRPLDCLAREAQSQIDCRMAEMHDGWINMLWDDRKERILQSGLWHAHEAAEQLIQLYDTCRYAARSESAADEYPFTASDVKRVLHNFQAQLGNRIFTENFGDKFQISPAEVSSILRTTETQFAPVGTQSLAMHRPN